MRTPVANADGSARRLSIHMTEAEEKRLHDERRRVSGRCQTPQHSLHDHGETPRHLLAHREHLLMR